MLNFAALRYLWAPLTTAAALGLRWLMHPLLQQEIPYEVFYVAVLVSARLGGIGSGLLAMGLGGVSAVYFFVSPHELVLRGVDNQVAFGMYVLVSACILRLHDEERQARLRAESGQRTLNAVLEHIPEGVAIADAPDARVTVVSRWGAKMAGAESEDLVNLAPPEQMAKWGVYHSDGLTPASWEELPMTRATVKGELVSDEEWFIRRPDGVCVPILCSAAPIQDGSGRITGGLAVWRDISQRKEMEEKLRETAKLESLGVLAGGIAHDFNNLLTSIMGHASLLIGSTPEGSASRGSARAILTASEVAAKLTQQMLAYSGRSRFVIEPVNLSELITGMGPLLQASLDVNIDLQFELAPQLPMVDADVSQLQQLLMNLLINAVEAMGPEGGRIRIVTRPLELDQVYLNTLLGAQSAHPGSFVLLEIQDSGSGIEDAILPRIFDPFFTTKFTGRGLGLSAVLGIVRGHHGGIKVYSAPGVGTTFRVYLPARA